MPCTSEALDVLKGANVLIAPSIAAGTGGVCNDILSFYVNKATLLVL